MSRDDADAHVTEPGATRVETPSGDPQPSGRRFARGDRTSVEPASASAPATSIETGSNGVAATSFEGAAIEETFTRVNLPRDLRDRFTPLEDIRTRGAEADLLLVADHGAGNEPRVLKLYRHSGERIDRAMLDLVRRAAEAHVVKVHDSGLTNGIWWELLEYCDLGSLADLIDAEGRRLEEELVHSIVAEVADALEHVHSLPCVHRDVKPANILVRTREPFDLVLADFGLATVIGHTKEMRSASRTVEYSAPEAAWGVVAPARDWWSLGIMLVEVITGKHPFTNEDPTPYEQRQIDAWLATRPIDVSGVEDDRLRLLCRGLLVRDPERRWGAEEVRQWRAGKNPPVAVDERASAHANVRAFAFWDAESRKTVQFRDPVALAAAIAHDPETWQRGLGIVGGGGSDNRKMRIEFRRFAESLGSDALTKILDDQHDSDPEGKLVRILVALDPDVPPTFRGISVDAAGLAALARSDGDNHGTIQALNDLGVLRIYSGASGAGSDLAECESEWDAIFAYAEQALRGSAAQLPEGVKMDDLVRAARVRALGAAADTEFAAEMEREAQQAVANPLARSQSWFTRVAAGRDAADSPIGHDIVTTLLAVPAIALGQREEARRLAAEKRVRDERRAQFGLEVRRSFVFVLFLTMLSAAVLMVPAGLLTEHVPHATAADGDIGAAALDAVRMAVPIGVALFLAGLGYNVWVYRRQAGAIDYWHMGSPRWFWLGLTLVPAGVIALIAPNGDDGYVPPVGWTIAGIAGAVAAVWLMLARIARRESGLELRLRAGVLAGLAIVAAAALVPSYGASRASTRSAFAAQSAALVKHGPMPGCRPLPYGKSPQRDFVTGGITCASHGYHAWVLRIPSDAMLKSYATQLRKDAEPARTKPHATCPHGRFAGENWSRRDFSRHGNARMGGQLLCFRGKKEAVLEWSNPTAHAYTTVARKDHNLSRIYRWWLTRARQRGIARVEP